MCVYSMIMDNVYDDWNKRYWPPAPLVPPTNYPPYWPGIQPPVKPSEQDLDFVKKLFEGAKKYDADNNEPDCELEEKKAKLRDLAAKLGVDISFIDQPTAETLQQAVSAFGKEFANKNLQAVGMGENEICAYLKKKVGLKKYPKEYHGFKVNVVVCGEFKLC